MARRRDIILDLPSAAAAGLVRWRQRIASKRSGRVPPPISQPKPPPKGVAALRALGWRILPLPGVVGSGPTARLHRTSNGWVGTRLGGHSARYSGPIAAAALSRPQCGEPLGVRASDFREGASMSGAGEAGDEDPIRLENLLEDIEGRLLDVTDGVYAITHMTRDTFNNPIEADGARAGIHYVALKLEEELRTLRDRAAESRVAWQRERPESWQDGTVSPKPEGQPRG